MSHPTKTELIWAQAVKQIMRDDSQVCPFCTRPIGPGVDHEHDQADIDGNNLEINS